MLFPTFELIAQINQVFTLEPGDLIFTGTPAGVGPLASGDKLTARLGNILQVFTRVA
jgi:2-keto-4-pentenoate hydratase/2-oxohepta-3-ene-1,7-dioic acid hydratase in catechol pathway